MLVILLIGVARFEKGRTCKQQFKTVDLYWAKPVATGWFPVSTVARFTSIPNSLESVPPPKNENNCLQTFGDSLSAVSTSILNVNTKY